VLIVEELEGTTFSLEQSENGEANQTTDVDSSSEEPSFVRAELHCILQTSTFELLESHFTSNNRVMQACCA